MTDEARTTALLAQSKELLGRVEATLAIPRPDPETRAEVDAIMAASAARKAASSPEPSKPAAVSARPAAGAYITRKAFNQYADALEKALSLKFQADHLAMLRRVHDVERRLSELES